VHFLTEPTYILIKNIFGKDYRKIIMILMAAETQKLKKAELA